MGQGNGKLSLVKSDGDPKPPSLESLSGRSEQWKADFGDVFAFLDSCDDGEMGAIAGDMRALLAAIADAGGDKSKVRERLVERITIYLLNLSVLDLVALGIKISQASMIVLGATIDGTAHAGTKGGAPCRPA